MIEVNNLTKKYDNTLAVDDISFKVNQGEIVGILGPNGAGKSTTLNIITGCLAPTSGHVSIDGKEILENPEQYKKLLGYLPENPPLYGDMTVEEYLKFVCELKKVPKVLKVHKLEDALSVTKLEDVKHKLIKQLSKGYKQRVGIAQALMGDPKVVILDEPTNGLDPSQIVEIRSIIRQLSNDRTILISSHILSEVSALCTKVIIIDKGKILAEDTPQNLSKSVEGSNKVFLKAKGDSDRILDIFKGIKSIIRLQILNMRENGEHDFMLEAISDRATEEMRKEIIRDLTDANIDVLEIRIHELTLEEIFLKYTGMEKALENESTTNREKDKSEYVEDDDSSDENEEEEEDDEEDNGISEEQKFKSELLKDMEQYGFSKKSDEQSSENETEQEPEEQDNDDESEDEHKKDKKELKEEKRKKDKEKKKKRREKEEKIAEAKREYNEQFEDKAKKDEVDKTFWGNEEDE